MVRVKLVLTGYALIIAASYFMVAFATTDDFQALALGGLAGSVLGVLMVLRLIGDDK